MPKRSSKTPVETKPEAASNPKRPKRPADMNMLAFQIVQEATGQAPPPEPKPDDGKNPAAVALGKLGGLKGGKARAKALAPTKRSEIAKKAAKTRWQKGT